MHICDSGTLGENEYFNDPCPWILYPFDFFDFLKCGGLHTNNLLLGHDEKRKLIEFVGILPYNE